ncbi:hypothetical protein PVAND_010182 [Polypedilum vanderplanki]|uniref:Mff-like domain-containing protein n=1 Tax=Polypedilum vanderplanki TaxID=319348 RepID=A0A9J6CEY6_POLVA|nr:hypothetical protein PVAND_010182 [Polypedilum vanderplanki]
MSTSPPNYDFEHDPLKDAYMNATFSKEISEKMRVPKRISANGEICSEEENFNGNNQMNSWNFHEKVDMIVPDRITVALGDDQHLGTRSQPREIELERSILPKEPGFIRVSTPPRVITLNHHHFPSASDEPEIEEENLKYYEPKTLHFAEDTKKVNTPRRKSHHSSQEMIINHRDETPPYSGMGSVENLSQSHDEVLHLRKQVAKLNRRLLNVEIDNLQRTQREKIICFIGVAYFVLKAIFWLNRK